MQLKIRTIATFTYETIVEIDAANLDEMRDDVMSAHEGMYQALMDCANNILPRDYLCEAETLEYRRASKPDEDIY